MTVQQANSEIEEVEGLGTPDDVKLGEYPLDTMMIRNETRTIHDILRRIDQDMFIMDPDFQRDFIWPENKQSKLIESVLMRIPLPVFYIAENEDGKMVVVDGLQRLSTFQNFAKGGLVLRLSEHPELNGKRFADLSPRLQNRVEDCNLTLYIIDSKAPERARLDIFERVNGGAPLTRQQMRNCLYVGQATRFLKEESNKDLFIRATGGSLNKAQMRDREFINRFCGFQIRPIDTYRGDMDLFLAETLKQMNGLSASELESLSKKLQIGLTNNQKVFDRHAFRKHTDEQTNRNTINASLWDVMMVGLSRYSEAAVALRAAELRQAFFKLLEDSDFLDAITIGTNQTSKVTQRFKLADKMFREVFGADSA